jgi:hypothetical protein
MPGPLITISTELMSNYKQAEIMAPDAKFQALQTTTGYALLFSIGTDGGFNVTREIPGVKTGWQKTVLSASIAGGSPPAKAKTFAVAQNRSDGSIDLAVAMSGGQNDLLYVSLGKSGSDTGWVAQPGWTAVPFDDLTHPLNKVVIENIFISEASDGEYIIVDVRRDPSSAVPVILRYYIDPTKQLTGQAWNPHDVAGDVDASAVSSCLGRRTGDRVDGLYTAGQIGGRSQLMFQPLYNPFNPAIPSNPVRLVLPSGAVGSALVAVSSGAGDDSTDLFVAAGRTIYYWPAGAQHDGSSGIALLTNPLFADVQDLFGYGNDKEVFLWGLNRADQVFYTKVSRAQVGDRASWSTPLPICQGAEQLSPYVNRINDGNTFFIHSGVNQLQRATQAPDTTTWKFENILLPTSPDAKAVKMNSYTTRIQVTDATKKPLGGAVVQISAQHRVGVYVNSLYYVLDTSPIGIAADATGSLSIVEWVDTLQATPLTATVSGAAAPAVVNPMDKTFYKASALSDASSLRSAKISDAGGASRPLVPASTSDDDLKVAASALSQLNTIYKTLPSNGAVALPKGGALVHTAAHSIQPGRTVSLAVAPAKSLRVDSPSSFGNAIEAAAGDVLSWLEHAASYVIHIVEDAASKVWHFVVEIAGAVYSFVLDAADKVVGALEAIYRAIKTAIEDLIAFLKFLFEWKDFVRTKDVCKKVVLLAADVIFETLETVKTELNGVIGDARAAVDKWAGLKSDTWTGSVENSNHPMGFMREVSDIGQFLTSPAMFLYDHFMENVGGAKGSPPSTGNAGASVLDRALAAIDNEGDVIIDAINRIKSELIDGSAFASMSLGDVLKKLVGIVVDAFLNSTENIMDALLDLLVLIGRAGVQALDTPIWIPVISDILADFGVKIDFSLLDVLMMVAAIPATLGYKLVVGGTPFSSGDGFSDKVLAAKDLPALISALGGTMVVPHSLGAGASGEKTIGLDPFKISLSNDIARTIYVVGHVIAGIGSMVSGVLAAAVALSGEPDPDTGKALAAAGFVTGTSAAIATLFETPCPIKDSSMYWMARVLSALVLVNKLGGWIAPYKLFGSSPTTEQSASVTKVTTAIDAVLAFLALTPSVYHFQELAETPAGSPRSAAIVTEVGNIVNGFNRIVNFFVIIDKDKESQAILAAIATVLAFLNGGLQFAEAAIDPI